MLKQNLGVCIFLSIASLCAIAAGEDGTGQAQPQLILTEPNQAVVQMSDDTFTALGRVTLQDGYGSATLDGVDSDTGSLQPNWGRVEVLNGCGSADVIVYQNIEGQEQEAWVGTVASAACE